MSTLPEILESQLGLKGVTVGPNFAKVEFKPEAGDAEAAWDMYVELLTRIATQPLDKDSGTDDAALNSIYSLFPTTRAILKEKGRNAKKFTQIAIIVLNKILRPFTSKWHKKVQDGKLESEHEQFREELEQIRKALRGYAKILSEMAQTDDLTDLLPD